MMRVSTEKDSPARPKGLFWPFAERAQHDDGSSFSENAIDVANTPIAIKVTVFMTLKNIAHFTQG